MRALDLSGRNVLVTGARGTIGAAVASAFIECGARAHGVDLFAGPDVMVADVTDEDALRAVVASMGTGLTDVVHAAGMVVTGTVIDTPATTVRESITANLVSAFALARATVPVMSGGGSFTVIASQAATHGSVGWSAYCAAKAGLLRLVESLAKESGPRGVRANAVLPGSVDSPMMTRVIAGMAEREGIGPAAIRARYESANPLGRLATVGDVADACVFLASPLASYINGAALAVDGGEPPG